MPLLHSNDTEVVPSVSALSIIVESSIALYKETDFIWNRAQGISNLRTLSKSMEIQ